MHRKRPEKARRKNDENHLEDDPKEECSKKENCKLSFKTSKKRQCIKVQLDIAKAVTNRTMKQGQEERKVRRITNPEDERTDGESESKRCRKVCKNDPKQKTRNMRGFDGRDHENEQKDEAKLRRRLKTPEYTTEGRKPLHGPIRGDGKTLAKFQIAVEKDKCTSEEGRQSRGGEMMKKSFRQRFHEEEQQEGKW